MLTVESLHRDGLSSWTLYTTPNAHAVITARGRELIEERPDVLATLRNYRRIAMGSHVGQLGVRDHLASGGNSDVYRAGPRLAMKEGSTGQSLWFALNRMDSLCDVIEESMPRWLDIPHHYGLLISPLLDRQYMLMQQIDAGVTVEHVLSGQAPTDAQNEILRTSFGDLTDEDRDQIRGLFDHAGRLMTEALVDRGMDPGQYMPDWHEGNMLIERQRVPIAGSQYKLWVIDQ